MHRHNVSRLRALAGAVAISTYLPIFASPVGNVTTPPSLRLESLIEVSNKEFKDSKCEATFSHLSEAVSLYEENANDEKSEQMFDCFTDISIHLEKCGHAEKSNALLLRIIHARMVRGFDDPLAATFERSHCGAGREPVRALEDYLDTKQRLQPRIGYGTNTDQAKLDRLIQEAKASDKPTNLIFLLLTKENSLGVRDNRIDSREELEVLRAKAGNQRALLLSMCQTADLLLRSKKYEQFSTKWNAIKAVYLRAKASKRKREDVLPNLSGYASDFAFQLSEDGQVGGAKILFTEAYNLALEEGNEYQILNARERLARFCLKCAKSNDKQTGTDLLTQCLRAAHARFGDDSWEVRECLISLSNFYAESDQRENAKATLRNLISSINKPGMSIAPDTKMHLGYLNKLLVEKEYLGESKKLEKRLREVEAE